MSNWYNVTYPDGVKRVQLTDEQLRHFERAVRKSNARVSAVAPADKEN